MDKHVTIEERLALMGQLDQAKALCARFGVTIAETFVKDRALPVIHAKHELWRLLASAGFSAAVLARLWSVHHTTVLDALKKEKPPG